MDIMLELFLWALPFLLVGAVTHPVAVRNAIADLVVGGSVLNGGTLKFRTSGDVDVASLGLHASAAFGAASSGTATAGAISSDTNAAGGTIAKAALRTSGGTDRVLCSVTAVGGGGDIELNSVVVSAGQTVSMSSLTYSAPA